MQGNKHIKSENQVSVSLGSCLLPSVKLRFSHSPPLALFCFHCLSYNSQIYIYLIPVSLIVLSALKRKIVWFIKKIYILLTRV